jgi:23S rRNA (uracil1939-C5)-methyltransferase
MVRRDRQTANKDQNQSLRTGQVAGVATDGSGVLREANQKTLFVPRTLEGESISAVVVSETSRLAHGRLVSLNESSLHRTSPPCVHYDLCGGCHLQHASPEHQTELKRSWFLETCRRVGGFRGESLAALDDTLKVMGLPKQRYRVRTRLQAVPKVSASGKTYGVLGFAALWGDSIVPVTSCLVLHPDLEAALPVLRHIFGDWNALGLPHEALQLELTRCEGLWSDALQEPEAKKRDAKLAVTLFKGGRQRLPLGKTVLQNLVCRLKEQGLPVVVPINEDILLVRPEWPSSMDLGLGAHDLSRSDHELAPVPTHRLGFLQPHVSAPAVYRAWLRDRVASSTKGHEHGAIWDLYAGSGLFGLWLAKVLVPTTDADPKTLEVHLVEANTQALGAAPNPLHPWTLHKHPQATEDFLEHARRHPPLRPRWIVLDPPRSGLGRGTITALVQALNAGQNRPNGQSMSTRIDVFLISCDGAAAARDLADLCALGLTIEDLCLVDAFGQTRHYEVLSHLVFGSG